MNEQQMYDENTCAKIFLKWLGSQQDGEWTFVRAEEKFPERANNNRWEFVAHRAGDSEKWIALEVKSLVFADGETQHKNWRKLVDDVNNRLQGRLRGKHWLADLPKYTFDQAQRKMLVDCLEGVILDAARTLEEGQQKDIGSSAAGCFIHWPKDTTKQPIRNAPDTRQALFPPHPLLLLKGSGNGSSLGIGISPFVGYWTEPALKMAIIGLLKGKGKANAQLGLAKCKGAARTVLLLDERIDFDPQIAAEVIRGLDASHLSNIDEVYLVSTFGGEHVQQVWPTSANRSW